LVNSIPFPCFRYTGDHPTAMKVTKAIEFILIGITSLAGPSPNGRHRLRSPRHWLALDCRCSGLIRTADRVAASSFLCHLDLDAVPQLVKLFRAHREPPLTRSPRTDLCVSVGHCCRGFQH
jgi:hypothetical protein